MLPHEFWQDLYPAGYFNTEGPFEGLYPASLGDGRQICLPIRPLGEGVNALASLIVNQASFEVLDALADDLAKKMQAYAPDVVVGMPTLGLGLAAQIARRLGHPRFVAMGTSRKFWYEDALSVPLTSITSPDQVKRLYLDPRMRPLLENKRVALVDDVISSGRSINAGLDLLALVGARPIVIGAAMLQSKRWLDALRQRQDGPFEPFVVGAIETPLLSRRSDQKWQST